LKAKAYFKAANLKESTDETKFFRAATMIGSLGFDVEADSNDDGLMDLGDVIDAFGGSTEGRNLWEGIDITFPDPQESSEYAMATASQSASTLADELPENAPTVPELQTFLKEVVRRDLEEAVAVLKDVNNTFQVTRTLPLFDEPVEIDYSDVLLLKGAAEALIGAVDIVLAYDLDVDYSVSTIQQGIEDNPNMLTLKDAAPLATAKEAWRNAGYSLKSALEYMQAETDDQSDDLVSLANLENEVFDNSIGVDASKTLIDQFIASLDGAPAKVSISGFSNPSDMEINIGPVFSSDLNLRLLLPNFEGNQPTGLFPDPTFGSTIIEVDGKNPDEYWNPDLDENGTSDRLEKKPSERWWDDCEERGESSNPPPGWVRNPNACRDIYNWENGYY
jgi:hypothetical protein